MLGLLSTKESSSQSANESISFTYQIKNNSDHQTAAWAHANILSVAQIVDGDLETVAAWAGEMVDLHRGVEGHVFDFNLVVDRE